MDNRRGEWWLLAQLLLITAHLLPVWPAPASFGVAIWPKPLFGLGLLLLISLAAVLQGKARFEEQGLLALHPQYSQYAAVTPAILGWVPGLDWR